MTNCSGGARRDPWGNVTDRNSATRRSDVSSLQHSKASLAARESSKTEPQPEGNRNSRSRIASDCVLSLLGSFYCLVLRTFELLVGDARNRRCKVLNIGPDCVDLVSQIFAVLF
jgi:hypothetical protein